MSDLQVPMSVIKDGLSDSEAEKLFPTKMGESRAHYLNDSLQLLGQGATAFVFRGYHLGLRVRAAVKFIKNEDLLIAKNTDDCANELEIWRQTNQSKHIIRLYDSYRDPKHGMFLAMEYADMTFKNKILECSPPRDDIIRWLYEVSSGVEYLHEKGVIHRDIKPGNILMVLHNKKLVAKLADFGVSRKLKEDKSSTNTNAAGSRFWMAPEALECTTAKFKNTKMLDIYALGLVIYFGLSKGKHPFGDLETDSSSTVHEKMTDDDAEPTLLVDEQYAAKDLLEKLIQLDPNSRPKILQVMSHCLFWNWEKEKDFLLEAAIALSGNGEEEVDMKQDIDKTYNSYYQKRYPGRTFNWMDLAKEKYNIDLDTMLIYRPERNTQTNEYGIDGTKGLHVTKIFKLIRDKYQHQKQLQCSAKQTFKGNFGAFSPEKYFGMLLSCCPDFVGVLYRFLEHNGNKPSLLALSGKFFPWQLERVGKDNKELKEISCEIKRVKGSHTIKVSKEFTKFGHSTSTSFETVKDLKSFSARKNDDGSMHYIFGETPPAPKDDLVMEPQTVFLNNYYYILLVILLAFFYVYCN